MTEGHPILYEDPVRPVRPAEVPRLTDDSEARPCWEMVVNSVRMTIPLVEISISSYARGSAKLPNAPDDQPPRPPHSPRAR